MNTDDIRAQLIRMKRAQYSHFNSKRDSYPTLFETLAKRAESLGDINLAQECRDEISKVRTAIDADVAQKTRPRNGPIIDSLSVSKDLM